MLGGVSSRGRILTFLCLATRLGLLAAFSRLLNATPQCAQRACGVHVYVLESEEKLSKGVRRDRARYLVCLARL